MIKRLYCIFLLSLYTSLLFAQLDDFDLSEVYYDVFNEFVDSGLDTTDYTGLNSFLTLHIPPGGKYEGMGTAFTGMTNDIGFFNANPSVSSRLNLSEVSFFHNNLFADVNMETIAVTGRWSDLGYGFQGKWLHIGFGAINDYGERELGAKGIYSEFILKNNLSWNFFRGFDFSGISVGTSLNLGYRNVPEEIFAHVIDRDQSSLAWFFDVGVLTEFNFLKLYSARERNFSIGLSILNVGREIIDGPDPLPTSGNLGIAYSPIEVLTLSYDLSYRFNLHESPSLNENGEFNEFEWKLSQGEGFYQAFGFDIQIIDIASLHGGFLYKPGLPRVSLGTEISYRQNNIETFGVEQDVLDSQNAYIFVINYKLDLTASLTQRISVEVKLNLGADDRFKNREKIQSLYVSGLQLFSDGEIEEAVKIWEKCLKLDSQFDPAIRMLDLAAQSLELQQKIIESKTVE